MKKLVFILVLLILVLLFVRSGNKTPQQEMEKFSVQTENTAQTLPTIDREDKLIKIAPFLLGSYPKNELTFLAEHPQVKFITNLGNQSLTDVTYFNNISDKPIYGMRTSTNVRPNSGNPFYGFWEDKLSEINSNEELFFHFGSVRAEGDWGTWLANPGNEDWVRIVTDDLTEKISNSYFEGVRMDVVYETLENWVRNCSFMQGKDCTPDNYDPETYKTDMINLIRAVKGAVGDKTVFINPMWPSYGGSLRMYEELAKIVDGSEIEQFAVHQQGHYIDETTWKKQLSTLMWNERNDIDTLAYSYVSEMDIDKRLYMLASFFIGAGQDSYFYIIPSSDEISFKSVFFFPEWELDLGDPLQTEYCTECTFPSDGYLTSESGLFVREYTNGKVLVNPSDQPNSEYIFDKEMYEVIPKGGKVRALGGNGEIILRPVQNITLGPKSGAIVLKENSF